MLFNSAPVIRTSLPKSGSKVRYESPVRTRELLCGPSALCSALAASATPCLSKRRTFSTTRLAGRKRVPAVPELRVRSVESRSLLRRKCGPGLSQGPLYSGHAHDWHRVYGVLRLLPNFCWRLRVQDSVYCSQLRLRQQCCQIRACNANNM